MEGKWELKYKLDVLVYSCGKTTQFVAQWSLDYQINIIPLPTSYPELLSSKSEQL